MDPRDEFEIQFMHGRTDARADNNIALFLGLFLLILAFFILLVAISSFEEIKSRAVIESVTTTFSEILPTTTRPQSATGSLADTVAGEEYFDQISGLFAGALQVTEVRIVQPGRHMIVRLPSGELFLPDGTELRANLQPLLDRMVAATSRRTRGLRFNIEMVAQTRQSVGGGLPIGQSLETARLGAFARAMRGRGAAEDAFVVALRQGDPAAVEFHFLARPVVDDPYAYLAGLPPEETP